MQISKDGFELQSLMDGLKGSRKCLHANQKTQHHERSNLQASDQSDRWNFLNQPFKVRLHLQAEIQ
jgi:hypothetical protein